MAQMYSNQTRNIDKITNVWKTRIIITEMYTNFHMGRKSSIYFTNTKNADENDKCFFFSIRERF